MTERLNFVCPDCGGEELEVQIHITNVGSDLKITRHDNGHFSVDWDSDQEYCVDYEVFCYFCKRYGFQIEEESGKPIIDYEELGRWIVAHCDSSNSLKKEYAERRNSRFINNDQT